MYTFKELLLELKGFGGGNSAAEAGAAQPRGSASQDSVNLNLALPPIRASEAAWIYNVDLVTDLGARQAGH